MKFRKQDIPALRYVLVNKEGLAVFCGADVPQCVGDFSKRFADLGLIIDEASEARVKKALTDRGWHIHHCKAVVHIHGEVKVF